jgi:hypothetical protein
LSGNNSRDDSSSVSSSLRRSFEEGGSEQMSSWSNFKRFLQHQFKFEALSLVKTSIGGLYGYVAFEAEWANVRGINYLNLKHSFTPKIPYVFLPFSAVSDLLGGIHFSTKKV